MTINVSEALDSDTAEVVTVTRTSSGSYVNGLYVAGSTSTFRTLASVQQPTPKDLQNLSEGERDMNPRLFISKKPLQTVSDRDNTIADTVTFKGKTFKIIKVGDWESFGHTDAFGVRVK